MEITVFPAAASDLDRTCALYDAVCDHLAAGPNLPGWRKGIYPARQDAEQGLADGGLFIAEVDGALAGSVILNHRPEAGYHTVSWQVECGSAEALVVHTLVVHPAFFGRGVGQRLLAFAGDFAKSRKMRAIRLDVYHKNVPAIKLYEKCGYHLAGTADLGYRAYGLDWFNLYEKMV